MNILMLGGVALISIVGATCAIAESKKLESAGTSIIRIWFRRVLKVFARLLWLYTVWCCLLIVFQDVVIFPGVINPSKSEINLPKDQILRLKGFDGVEVLAGILKPTANEELSKKPAVIFFHGNNERIEQWINWGMLRRYQEMGFYVILPEFRGFGNAPGYPSKDAISEDMQLVYREVLKISDIDPNKIIFHGRSLGGGVACDLASHYKPYALILQSTFSSTVDLAQGYLIPLALANVTLKHKYDNLDVLSHIEVPTLVMHGTKDFQIPFSNGEELYSLAVKRMKPVKFFTPPFGHNDIPMNDSYWEEIKGFLNSL